MTLALSTEQQQECLTRGAANRAKWDQISVALAAITAHANRLNSLAGSLKFVGRYATKAAFEIAASGELNYSDLMTQGYTPAYLIDEGKIMAFAVDTSNPLYTGTPDFEYVGGNGIGFEYSAQESLDSAAISTLIAGATAPLATKTELTNAVSPLATVALVQTVQDAQAVQNGRLNVLAADSATKVELADAVAPLATTVSVMQAQTALSSQIGDLDLTVQDHTLAITQVKDRVTVLEAN